MTGKIAPMKHPSRAALVAGFAAIYFIWGSTFLAIRFAVATIPAFFMAAARHGTAGVVLYAFARRSGAPRPTARQWRNAAIIGALLLSGSNGVVSLAETRVASGPAALIVASIPLWMLLLSSAMARRWPSRPVAAGVALGLFGVALLVLPHGGAGDRIDPVGSALLLFAALSWSVGSLLSRQIALPRSSILSTGMQCLAGGALLVVMGLVTGEGRALHPAAITLRSVLSLGYLIAFGSIVAFSAYVWLLQVVPPERVSTYAFVNPIVAVVVGVAAAGEVLTLRIALAALAVVGAVALILLFGSPRRARAALAEAAPRRTAGERNP